MSSQVAIDSKILHGKPRIKGTRIAVSMVLELLADGISPKEICERWYPDLTIADVHACIAFANRFLSGEEIHLARESRRPARA